MRKPTADLEREFLDALRAKIAGIGQPAALSREHACDRTMRALELRYLAEHEAPVTTAILNVPFGLPAVYELTRRQRIAVVVDAMIVPGLATDVREGAVAGELTTEEVIDLFGRTLRAAVELEDVTGRYPAGT